MPRALRAFRGGKRAIWLSFCLVSLIACVGGVLFTQVRAVWLGLAIALSAGLLIYFILARRRPGAHPVVNITLTSCLLLMVLVTTALLEFTDIGKRIESRLAISEETIEELQQALSLDSVPMTSSSVRVASWVAGFRWFVERPLLGWGPGTTDDLIDQSSLFSPSFKSQFGHLHNSYMETLVALGLVGTLILATLTLWIGWTTIRALKTKAMPMDAFVFSWVFFGYWLVVNVFESYIMFNTGHFLVACVGAFVYAFYLNSSVTGRASSPLPD